jgi:hypothetical protein
MGAVETGGDIHVGRGAGAVRGETWHCGVRDILTEGHMNEQQRIKKLATNIRDWLTGIELSIANGDVSDLEAVRRELQGVEKTLEQITSEIILDR